MSNYVSFNVSSLFAERQQNLYEDIILKLIAYTHLKVIFKQNLGFPINRTLRCYVYCKTALGFEIFHSPVFIFFECGQNLKPLIFFFDNEKEIIALKYNYQEYTKTLYVDMDRAKNIRFDCIFKTKPGHILSTRNPIFEILPNTTSFSQIY